MRKNLVIAAAATLLSLLALELGLRLYLTEFGDLRQKVLYLYSRDEIQQLPTAFRGLAYLNFGLSPDYHDHNSLGYRGPEIGTPKPPGTFRIVALGGSTTYGVPLDSWRLAYPHQLQTALRDEYGYAHVEVINAGTPMYSTWESAVNMLLRMSDLQPDLVIIYHGINDLQVRLVDPEQYEGLNAARGIWELAEDPLPPSSLLRIAWKKLGFELDIAYELVHGFRIPDGYRNCKPGSSDIDGKCADLDMTVSEVLAANPPVYFERNLRNMIRLADGLDSKALLLTFAYSPLEYEVPRGASLARQYMQAGIAEQNALVRAVSDEHQMLFYDLAATMPIDKPLWADDVHMSAAGTKEMARQLAKFLAESGALES